MFKFIKNIGSAVSSIASTLEVGAEDLARTSGEWAERSKRRNVIRKEWDVKISQCVNHEDKVVLMQKRHKEIMDFDNKYLN